MLLKSPLHPHLPALGSPSTPGKGRHRAGLAAAASHSTALPRGQQPSHALSRATLPSHVTTNWSPIHTKNPSHNQPSIKCPFSSAPACCPAVCDPPAALPAGPFGAAVALADPSSRLFLPVRPQNPHPHHRHSEAQPCPVLAESCGVGCSCCSAQTKGGCCFVVADTRHFKPLAKCPPLW